MKPASFFTIILSVIVLFASISIATVRNVPSEFATIQAAIDASGNGDVVIIAPGTYQGAGNKNLDFGGRTITVRGTEPNNHFVTTFTIIDCENSGRGFYFHSGEGNDSIVAGLKIYRGGITGTPGIGGGIYINGASPTIKNCIITQCNVYGANGAWASNGYQAYGGGIYLNNNSTVNLINCEITFNAAHGGRGGDGGGMPPDPPGSGGNAYGGGIYGSNFQLINCLVASNSAIAGLPGGGDPGPQQGFAFGGAIKCGQATISNCTIANNIIMGEINPGEDTGGIYGNAQTNITNCILWNNTNGDLLYCSATYSCLEDGTPGTGNISSNPLFVAGPDGVYCLSQIAAGQATNSPCINAGSDTSLNLGMNTYTTRTDRIADMGIVDMGYHYQALGQADFNGDGIVDFVDFAILGLQWLGPPGDPSADISPFGGNGIVDIYDLKEFANHWLMTR